MKLERAVEAERLRSAFIDLATEKPQPPETDRTPEERFELLENWVSGIAIWGYSDDWAASKKTGIRGFMSPTVRVATLDGQLPEMSLRFKRSGPGALLIAEWIHSPTDRATAEPGRGEFIETSLEFGEVFMSEMLWHPQDPMFDANQLTRMEESKTVYVQAFAAQPA